MRRTAIRGLRPFHDERILDALVAALKENDPLVWHAAMHELAIMPDERVGEVLLPLLAENDAPSVSIGAMRALAARKDARAITPLMKLASSRYPWVANAAQLALKRIGSQA